MNIYSIKIPLFASSTIYKDKSNIWRHTQDPANPAPHYLYSNNLWNSVTKQFDKINTNYSTWPDYSNLNRSEDSSYVHPEDVQEFVNIHVKLTEANMENIDYEEEMQKYNIFVIHSDLDKDPVHIAIIGTKGVGETLWKRS